MCLPRVKTLVFETPFLNEKTKNKKLKNGETALRNSEVKKSTKKVIFFTVFRLIIFTFFKTVILFSFFHWLFF
jgi:hypothetical protein